MKIIKSNLTQFTLIIGLLVFFQSCIAYKITSKSLDEIVKSKTKVKIITSDNRVQKFKRVVVYENNYYGVKWNNDYSKNILLYPSDINAIKSPDKAVSIVASVIGGVILTSLIVYRFFYFGLF